MNRLALMFRTVAITTLGAGVCKSSATTAGLVLRKQTDETQTCLSFDSHLHQTMAALSSGGAGECVRVQLNESSVPRFLAMACRIVATGASLADGAFGHGTPSPASFCPGH